MNEKEIVACTVLTALFLLLVPLGYDVEIWEIGVGILIAFLACMVLFFTKESRINLVIVVLLISLPFWWMFAGEMTSLLAVASIAFIIPAAFFLVTSYDQIEVKQEHVVQESMPEVYLAVLLIAVVITYFAPIQPDTIQVGFLAVSLGIALAWLFKNVGVGVALPTLALLAVIPLVLVLWWPDIIWENLISSSLVIALWSSLGAYAVLHR